MFNSNPKSSLPRLCNYTYWNQSIYIDIYYCMYTQILYVVVAGFSPKNKPPYEKNRYRYTYVHISSSSHIHISYHISTLCIYKGTSKINPSPSLPVVSLFVLVKGASIRRAQSRTGSSLFKMGPGGPTYCFCSNGIKVDTVDTTQSLKSRWTQQQHV